MYTVDIDNNDYAMLHDVVWDSVGKDMSHEELDVLIRKMPEYIISNAAEWGFSDTVVRDDVFKWVKGVR